MFTKSLCTSPRLSRLAGSTVSHDIRNIFDSGKMDTGRCGHCLIFSMTDSRLLMYLILMLVFEYMYKILIKLLTLVYGCDGRVA